MFLDNILQIKNLDKGRMLASIEALADQCREAWKDLAGVSVPREYSQVKNIVVAGMGGWALGAYIIRALYGNEMKISLEIANDYHLPAYVNKDTLVVLSSYSGSTEETLSCLVEAKKKNAKILVMTTGKDLAEFKKDKKLPGYLFTPHFNPCNSPRMGLGYSLFGSLILFGKIGFIKFSEFEAQKAIKIAEKYNRELGVYKKITDNRAKQLAEKLKDKIPFYFSASHLAGNIHTAANQLNENAKVFAYWALLPEINHHLMEGLLFPAAIKKDLILVFLESTSDEPKIRKRFALTREVAKKRGVEAVSYMLQEKTPLGQSFELLVLGSYVSFYLAMLYDLDPTPIPMVDWFKKNM
ncbi:MAG: SIS domain-containing protein [Candidatus Magasanikbacteria bacterium]|nr:SIS domain-containing protein [Candidatus Magasanikbacteria bacterium]